MSKKVIIVGGGGIGSWLASGIARMLEYREPNSILVIVDGDNFEPKNQERQSFRNMGNKAEVLYKELQPLFPNTFIIPDKRWVVETMKDPEGIELDPEGVVTAQDLISDGDVVFAVVDNHATRKILFDAAAKVDNIDCFTGGNDDNLFGSVYHYQRRDGKDITDHPTVWHNEFVNPPDRNPGLLSCQERAELEGGTQLLAVNMAVAATLLARMHKTVIEGKEDREAEIMFDLGLGISQPYDYLVESNSTNEVSQ